MIHVTQINTFRHFFKITGIAIKKPIGGKVFFIFKILLIDINKAPTYQGQQSYFLLRAITIPVANASTSGSVTTM